MAALTEVDADLVARLDRLTRERIAPRAAEYDAAAQNPVESWRDLWREGFLGAAIPAVMGYNVFVNRVKHWAVEMDSFALEFLNVVGRSFSKPAQVP